MMINIPSDGHCSKLWIQFDAFCWCDLIVMCQQSISMLDLIIALSQAVIPV